MLINPSQVIQLGLPFQGLVCTVKQFMLIVRVMIELSFVSVSRSHGSSTSMISV